MRSRNLPYRKISDAEPLGKSGAIGKPTLWKMRMFLFIGHIGITNCK